MAVALSQKSVSLIYQLPFNRHEANILTEFRESVNCANQILINIKNEIFAINHEISDLENHIYNYFKNGKQTLENVLTEVDSIQNSVIETNCNSIVMLQSCNQNIKILTAEKEVLEIQLRQLNQELRNKYDQFNEARLYCQLAEQITDDAKVNCLCKYNWFLLCMLFCVIIIAIGLFIKSYSTILFYIAVAAFILLGCCKCVLKKMWKVIRNFRKAKSAADKAIEDQNILLKEAEEIRDKIQQVSMELNNVEEKCVMNQKSSKIATAKKEIFEEIIKILCNFHIFLNNGIKPLDKFINIFETNDFNFNSNFEAAKRQRKVFVEDFLVVLEEAKAIYAHFQFHRIEFSLNISDNDAGDHFQQ